MNGVTYERTYVVTLLAQDRRGVKNVLRTAQEFLAGPYWEHQLTDNLA